MPTNTIDLVSHIEDWALRVRNWHKYYRTEDALLSAKKLLVSLEKGDLAAARKWADEIDKLQPGSIDNTLWSILLDRRTLPSRSPYDDLPPPIHFRGASQLLPSELANLARKASGKTHADAMKIIKKEFPNWVEGDLVDAANSVSPSMSSDARRVQKRYQELTKSASTESPMMILPSELARLRSAKFPAGVSMTIDEVAAVVGPEFKEMNENPPPEVIKLREEMMDKSAAKHKMPVADLSLHVKGKFPDARVQLGGVYGEGSDEISAAVDAIPGFKEDRSKVTDVETAKALMEKAKDALSKNKSFKISLTTDSLDLPELTIKWVGKTARFEEGPEGAKDFAAWMSRQPQSVQDDWKKHTEENGDKFKTASDPRSVLTHLSAALGAWADIDFTPEASGENEFRAISDGLVGIHARVRSFLRSNGKMARYEEGQPADPTAEMSPEDAQKWKENTEKYGDKFTDEEAMLSKFQDQLLPSESFALTAAQTRRRSTWKVAADYDYKNLASRLQGAFLRVVADFVYENVDQEKLVQRVIEQWAAANGVGIAEFSIQNMAAFVIKDVLEVTPRVDHAALKSLMVSKFGGQHTFKNASEKSAKFGPFKFKESGLSIEADASGLWVNCPNNEIPFASHKDYVSFMDRFLRYVKDLNTVVKDQAPLGILASVAASTNSSSGDLAAEIGATTKGPLESEPDEPYMKGQFTQENDGVLQVAAVQAKKAEDDIAGGIGAKMKGPMESDKDEKYMKGQFTQTENSELSGKVAKGQKVYGHLEWLE